MTTNQGLMINREQICNTYPSITALRYASAAYTSPSVRPSQADTVECTWLKPFRPSNQGGSQEHFFSH